MSFQVKDVRRKAWFWCDNAIFDSGLSYKAKLVYLYFCRRVNDSGTCFVGLRRMVSDIGLGRTTIKKSIKELAARDFLKVEIRMSPDGDRDTNLYTVMGFDSGDHPADLSPQATDGQSQDAPPVSRQPTIKDYPSEGLLLEGLQLPNGSHGSPRRVGQGSRPSKQDQLQGLGEFWAEYPNHKGGTKAAERAWISGKCWAKADVILRAVREQKTWPQWQKDGGQYVPLAQTWLHQERWTAEQVRLRPAPAPRRAEPATIADEEWAQRYRALMKEGKDA